MGPFEQSAIWVDCQFSKRDPYFVTGDIRAYKCYFRSVFHLQFCLESRGESAGFLFALDIGNPAGVGWSVSVGRYKADNSSSSCDPCPPGSCSSHVGSTTCGRCPADSVCPRGCMSPQKCNSWAEHAAVDNSRCHWSTAFYITVSIVAIGNVALHLFNKYVRVPTHPWKSLNLSV